MIIESCMSPRAEQSMNQNPNDRSKCEPEPLISPAALTPTRHSPGGPNTDKSWSLGISWFEWHPQNSLWLSRVTGLFNLNSFVCAHNFRFTILAIFDGGFTQMCGSRTHTLSAATKPMPKATNMESVAGSTESVALTSEV